MCLPSGENATDLIIFVCPRKGPKTVSPVRASKIRIVLYSEPETIRFPSGEYANAKRLEDRHCSSVTVWHVSASHMRIVESPDPETICLPSGEKAMDQTLPECPRRGSPIASLVWAFQSRIVLSDEPEAMRFPSGENATDVT
jgi:hypothetical protein